MAQTRTSGPRISPAWIAGLLSGETRCQWASWFKAHHEDWKTVEMSDLSGVDWRVQYTYQLNDCIKRYEEQGYTVSNGEPNAYTFNLGEAVLSDSPDVIATKGNDCIVIDFPKGRPNRSHALQVITHIYALPRSLERLRGMSPRGQLAYWQELVDIPSDSLDREFIENLHRQAQPLAAGQPLARVPSPDECWTCDITAADCPQRMKDDGTRPFRMPDPPGGEEFAAMLQRAEWAEADRDMEYRARTRAELRIEELEQEVSRLESL